MKVHVLAELFPVLPEEDLQELAEDIKTNGLRLSIIKDKDGVLLDGRNRLAACKLAGVEPRFEIYDGDPVAFILSTNVHRRHLSKGAQAMALAIAYPEPTRLKRAGSDVYSVNINKSLISQARTVLAEFGADSDVVKQVMAGGSLKEAYETAQDRKRQRDDQNEKLKNLRLLMEQIGPEKHIQINKADLEAGPSFSELAKDLSRDMFPKIEEQGRTLSFLVGLERQIKEFRSKPVVEGGWSSQAYYSAIISSMSQIVEHCLEVSKQHKEAAAQPRMKVVK